MRPVFDERDQEIRERRAALLSADESPHPRVGDWVVFACGTTRRVSHVWAFDDVTEQDWDYQTSADGYGYYLGELGPEWTKNGHNAAYVAFSGSLFRSVKRSTLTRTDELRDGRVWFFHHGWQEAHNGVETAVPFRVYTCSEEAPQ